VTDLWESGAGCLSVQVLKEFFVTVTRRVPQPLSAVAAADIVKDLSAWTIFAPRAEDGLEAIALHQRAQVSFRDALILHAAAELGCAALLSEDLNPGQRVRGVRITNPFLH
jgi:predicted nucleic acid-binding protein